MPASISTSIGFITAQTIRDRDTPAARMMVSSLLLARGAEADQAADQRRHRQHIVGAPWRGEEDEAQGIADAVAGADVVGVRR